MDITAFLPGFCNYVENSISDDFARGLYIGQLLKSKRRAAVLVALPPNRLLDQKQRTMQQIGLKPYKNPQWRKPMRVSR